MRYRNVISLGFAALGVLGAHAGFCQETQDRAAAAELLGAVYRASLATGFHETTEGGLVDGHWVSVKKALASVDSSGYTLSFTPLITDSIEVKNINITPRHSSESVEQKYHLGRQHTARVSFSDVTRIRLDKDRFGNLMNVYLLGATGEPLDGLSATDWASKPIAGSKNLVAAIHTLCPNATEERGAGTALPLGAANTGAIGLPFTLPNDSAVRVANTGIMVLLRHMGYAAQSAEIYVVAGEPNGPEGIGPYRNDRATSDRNIAKFRSAHKSCDGSLMHIAGYEVRCFRYQLLMSERMDGGSAQSLGSTSSNGRVLDLFAVDFGTNWVEVEAFDANQ